MEEEKEEGYTCVCLLHNALLVGNTASGEGERRNTGGPGRNYCEPYSIIL